MFEQTRKEVDIRPKPASSQGRAVLTVGPEALEFLSRLAMSSCQFDQMIRGHLLSLGNKIVARTKDPERLKLLSETLIPDRPPAHLHKLLVGMKEYGDSLRLSMLRDPRIVELLGEAKLFIERVLTVPNQEPSPSATNIESEIVQFLKMRCDSLISSFIEVEPNCNELKSFLRRMLRAELLFDEQTQKDTAPFDRLDSEMLTEAFRHVFNSAVDEDIRRNILYMFDAHVAEGDELSPEKLLFINSVNGLELSQQNANISDRINQALKRILTSETNDSTHFSHVSWVFGELSNVTNFEHKDEIVLGIFELLADGKTPIRSRVQDGLFLAELAEEYPQLFDKIPNITAFLQAQDESSASARLRTVAALRATSHENVALRNRATKALSSFVLTKQSSQDPMLADRVAYMEFQLKNDPSLAAHYSRTSSDVGKGSLLDGLSGSKDRNHVDARDDLPRLPAAVQPALRELERVLDLYFGYGALLFEAKRTPLGEQALLSRFATDHGSLHYLNAIDPATFPGRGLVISNLKTRSLFPLKRDTMDLSFSIYRSAWPRYARAISDFDRAEFIFTRGMVFISVRDGLKYSLAYSNQDKRFTQYGLAVFNSHFGDPESHFAALIPTVHFKRLLRGTLIDGQDYTGVTPALTDAKDSLRSPRHLCQLPDVIPLGNIDSLLSVGPAHNHSSNADSPIAKLRHHDEMVRIWDQWFISRGRISEEDAARLSSYTDVRIAPGSLARAAYAAENMLHERASQLEATLNQTTQQDAPQLELLRQLLDVFDLFKISLSYWHRGYTIPVTGKSSKFETNEEREENDKGQQLNIQQSEVDEIAAHPEALKMLRFAREFHQAQTLEALHPTSDPKQFPILVSCPALQLSNAPDGHFFLDTFSMNGAIAGKPFKLSSDAMGSLEDDAFFLSEVLSQLQDSSGNIRDLKFVSRAALDEDFFDRHSNGQYSMD